MQKTVVQFEQRKIIFVKIEASITRHTEVANRFFYLYITLTIQDVQFYFNLMFQLKFDL